MLHTRLIFAKERPLYLKSVSNPPLPLAEIGTVSFADVAANPLDLV